MDIGFLDSNLCESQMSKVLEKTTQLLAINRLQSLDRSENPQYPRRRSISPSGENGLRKFRWVNASSYERLPILTFIDLLSSWTLSPGQRRYNRGRCHRCGCDPAGLQDAPARASAQYLAGGLRAWGVVYRQARPTVPDLPERQCAPRPFVCGYVLQAPPRMPWHGINWSGNYGTRNPRSRKNDELEQVDAVKTMIEKTGRASFDTSNAGRDLIRLIRRLKKKFSEEEKRHLLDLINDETFKAQNFRSVRPEFEALYAYCQKSRTIKHTSWAKDARFRYVVEAMKQKSHVVSYI